MKLVREYIYEKFTEEGDPIKDMGIGNKKTIIIKKLDKLAKKYGFKSIPVSDPINHPYNYFDDNGVPVLHIIKVWNNPNLYDEGVEITLTHDFKNKNKFNIGVEYIGKDYCEHCAINFPDDIFFEDEWWKDL
jgi:hypothetical protein